jgi:uncharacterized protein
MAVYVRELEGELRKASRAFPSVVLSGPRRAGKTFLLRHTFPQASYHLLEDPDVLARAKADPRGWLEEVRLPAIVDEVQNAPELFAYVRTRIDESPRKRGQWFLAGSQDFSLMAGVAESMAGRAAVLRLSPLSFRETGSWSLARGGFPEVVSRPRSRRLWFGSYVQTYLERDVRSLLGVRDLSTFRRFLTLLASRNGQLLNRSDLAAPLGVSVPTISSWLSVLETTGHVLLVPPFYENLGKRLVKSPKVYWIDSGLLCFLLGIDGDAQLARSPFVGPVFEGFVASEIVKNQQNHGQRGEIYFFRDEQGLEVDFLAIAPGGSLRVIEARWSKTIRPEDATPVRKLLAALGSRRVDATIVHPKARSSSGPTAVAPGVKTLDVEAFLSA